MRNETVHAHLLVRTIAHLLHSKQIAVLGSAVMNLCSSCNLQTLHCNSPIKKSREELLKQGGPKPLLHGDLVGISQIQNLYKPSSGLCSSTVNLVMQLNVAFLCCLIVMLIEC